MMTSETLGERNWIRRDLLGGMLLVLGVVLAGMGGYFHVTIATQVNAGQCNGCEPWHLLFVLAPLSIGATLFLLAGYLLSR